MIKLYPYISEKSADLAKRGKFTMLAPLSATKSQVLNSLRKVFEVQPIKINPITKKSLPRLKLRKAALDRGFKKFIVTLPKGKTIVGFESVLEEKKDKKDKKTPVSQEKKAVTPKAPKDEK